MRRNINGANSLLFLPRLIKTNNQIIKKKLPAGASPLLFPSLFVQAQP
jgi:hypothetical protein